MAPNKQVKVVFDGRPYWLLWHWETFQIAGPNLSYCPLHRRSFFRYGICSGSDSY